jgi:hypothetical protein
LKPLARITTVPSSTGHLIHSQAGVTDLEVTRETFLNGCAALRRRIVSAAPGQNERDKHPNKRYEAAQHVGLDVGNGGVKSKHRQMDLQLL